MDIQKYFNTAYHLVKKCGQILLESQEENIEVQNKSIREIVTKYDTKIENILITELKSTFPQHKFLGEESSNETESLCTLTNTPTWIIDPIDGTTNFSKKNPLCGISVGLTIDKQQIIGIVYLPFLDEIYTAIKDHGAYMNGKKITCSQITEVNQSLFCYEISVASKNNEIYNSIMTKLGYLIKEVLAIRSFGSPVLSLCYVASGKLDAYQCEGLYPWDAAAGTLLVREAGGYVIDLTGGEFDLMKPNFLAACTKSLSEKYLNLEGQK